MGGRGSSGVSGGGTRGGSKSSPQQKSLMEKARDGDLTSTDFNKMDTGSRAYLLGQTPRGTIVTTSNGTQYTHTGDNQWSRSGRDVVLGRSAARTAVNNMYVAQQTTNDRMRSIRYKK